MRDRFVCGLRTKSTKKRLLTEKKLTFVSTVELAQSLETALKDAKEQKEEASGSVLNVTTPKPGKVACYRCGQMNHKARECPFKVATYHKCSILRLLVGAGGNHSVENDSFTDTRGLLCSIAHACFSCASCLLV